MGIFLNKAAHKPCSVSKQSSVWHWNYFQFLAISLKLANSLYSLHFNLAFSRGVPSRYFSISLVKLLTHRCTIARTFKAVSSIIPVVLSTGSHRPEFLRLLVLECTDFPHLVNKARLFGYFKIFNLHCLLLMCLL